eukprot:15359636-Ditylum_brightwellii.AAC.1
MGQKQTQIRRMQRSFAEHFEKQFNNTSSLPCDETVLEELFDVPEFFQLTAPPTVQEVKDALKQMASNKAP